MRNAIKLIIKSLRFATIGILLFIFNFSFLINNCFSQWFIQNSGTTNALYDIEFINENTGWCCGEGGYIIKTTNGGANWFSLDTGSVGPTGSYRCVFFINKNTGWISNRKSPDFGIKKTTDGGNTFTLSSFFGITNDLYFKDSLNGIGVSGVALIFRTTNGGANWVINQLAGSGDFHRVSFINKDTGYVASHRAVYKTTNLGVNWDSIGTIPTSHTTYGCEFSSDSIGWVATSHELFKTTNGGINWITQNITPGVTYSIWSFNDSLVWTCGNGGRIWHTTTGGNVFVNQISSNIPDRFNLHQNYPNPFNSQTTIKFDIIKKGNYSIEIYDLLGRKHEELFDEYLDAGSYRITYNANKLSSGVYFYRLHSDKMFITKKFLLIK